MKKIVYLLVVVCCFVAVESVYAGAKKPKVMVVPSDNLLKKIPGALEFKVDDMGVEQTIRHYERAFLNDEVRAVIAKFDEMMKERGFPTKDMNHLLKKARKRGRQVHYDIKIELNYKIEKSGPRKSLYVEFKGIDEYTGVPVATASGTSAPAIGSSVIELLQEAVLDKIDHFNEQLMGSFNDMAEKGRESVLLIESDSFDFEEEVGGQTLEDLVDAWLTQNCVGQNFSLDSDDSGIEVTQAMMPLFNEKGKALDARTFYKSLVMQINAFVAGKGNSCKIESKKLGELIIVIK